MPFDSYISELTGAIPRLSPQYASTIINRAWSDIRDMRLWSFLFGYGDIYAPPVVSAGSFTATEGSNLVIADVTAAAACIAVALLPAPIPPLSSPTLGQGRQWRVSNTPGGGSYYSITAFDGVNTLTLDRPFAGNTGANQSYQIAKVYYATPVTPPDFVRYISVVNRNTGYSINGPRLIMSQTRLNSFDPQRSGQGDAYLIANYQPDSTGNPVHEWYPTPTNAAVYNCFFQRRGQPLSPTNDLPQAFMGSVLMYRALMLACDWASGNVATYPDLANVNWVQTRMAHEKNFKEQLTMAIRQDDELMPMLPYPQGGGPSAGFPLGGEFLQGHDVSGIVGGLFS